jgi:hypothetical protein
VGEEGVNGTVVGCTGPVFESEFSTSLSHNLVFNVETLVKKRTFRLNFLYGTLWREKSFTYGNERGLCTIIAVSL